MEGGREGGSEGGHSVLAIDGVQERSVIAWLVGTPAMWQPGRPRGPISAAKLPAKSPKNVFTQCPIKHSDNSIL